VLAYFAGGKAIDVISNKWTIRNNGRRESEYRLASVVVPGIIGPCGILLFGLAVASHENWVATAFGYGMQGELCFRTGSFAQLTRWLGFGLSAASNVIITYAVDCYLPFAGEVLVVIFVIRNVIGVICKSSSTLSL
jgi:hypothetical protein